jgi:hypothetical protein
MRFLHWTFRIKPALVSTWPSYSLNGIKCSKTHTRRPQFKSFPAKEVRIKKHQNIPIWALICPSARKRPAKEAREVHDKTIFSPVYQIFRTQILIHFPRVFTRSVCSQNTAFKRRCQFLHVNHRHFHTWASCSRMTQPHGVSMQHRIHIFLPRCWDCYQCSVANTNACKTVKRNYRCKKFKRTQHVTNMAYVPPVLNQKSPCWLQTFLKHSAPSLRCLIAVHNEIYDISSSVVSYTFLACVAAENLHWTPTEHTATVTAFTLTSIIWNTVCKNLYTCILRDHFTLYMCAGLRSVQRITAHTSSHS